MDKHNKKGDIWDEMRPDQLLHHYFSNMDVHFYVYKQTR